jgi:hypothetical protein
MRASLGREQATTVERREIAKRELVMRFALRRVTTVDAQVSFRVFSKTMVVDKFVFLRA